MAQPHDAEVVLVVLEDRYDKTVAASTAGGQVVEFRLRVTLRFRLDKATLGALLSRWTTMTAPEKLAFVDSMRSSFRAGSLDREDVCDAQIELLDTAEARYVSRGGLKLEGALKATGLQVAGLRCMDIGQSTGGFTDCLLQHGAAHVVGVDVGSNQVHPNIRADERVTCIEGVNARELDASDLIADDDQSTLGEAGSDPEFDFVTGDLSFISLTLVLPALVPFLKTGGNLLALVKPAALDKLANDLLREVQSQQAVYTLKGEADILAIAQQAGVVCVHVMTVRGGRVLGGKNFFPDLAVREDAGAVLSEFMASFYFQLAEELPDELITSVVLPDQAALQAALAEQFGQKVSLKSRVRETRADWLELAELNASTALKARLGNQLELRERFRLLQDLLAGDLQGRVIDRIECFDISHTMGEATVASCVVFDQGGARKRDYRQYSISDITGGDDYAAMRQALKRRYSKQPLPDLLLIDGGKGQLGMAREVMAELGLNPLMLGVSKGEGRRPGLETLHWVDGRSLQLEPDHKALHLIQQVRDEAHRFAITRHRAKRDKRRGGSVLELIPGLGPKRRRDLLTHFGGIQQLLSASENEIAAVSGIGRTLARTVYQVLHE